MHDFIEHPEITLDFSGAPKTESSVYLNSNAFPLNINFNGPFARNQDFQLVCVHDKNAYVSDDNGNSWQSFEVFSNDAPFSILDSHSILCTQQGTLIVSFFNTAQFHFNWRKKTNRPTKNCMAHHYIVRSLDGGRTWEEPILVQTGYVATATTLIELKSGAILASTQNMDYDAARHYSLSFRSEDNGKTWSASNKLDIGGQGHHDGCYEGTVVELKDKVWFCIRTNLDYFWHAYSYDDGKSWTHLEPGIEASSSPAMLKRLSSGNILMVYNPLYPSGKTSYPRRAGQFSQTPASWHREELVAILSKDDAASWSKPVILAKCQGAWLSYPYLFEANPGEIWLTTMQSELRIKFKEAELFKSYLANA